MIQRNVYDLSLEKMNVGVNKTESEAELKTEGATRAEFASLYYRWLARRPVED